MTRNAPEWSTQQDGSVCVSHRVLGAGDAPALLEARHLILWNVRLPSGFLATLPRLELLDLRGGSSADLRLVEGCSGLRGLIVNQIRGLKDLSAIEALTRLELLSLYGLAQVDRLPDLSKLPSLRRLDLGQLRSLCDWSPLLRASGLEQLSLANKLDPDLETMSALAAHQRLRYFDWYAPDESASRVRAVSEAVARPRSKPSRPEAWFAENC
jgi:hypothetical protein